ncbi:hypothetical protein [Fibrella aquatilis]|uniref:Uncharacterized protein n=1 Tax=Fibrella aquatilis TaxID=2817059 RepID=A0A939G473_9BACT|nr:hypothetical protein [Fibrella aquatilis]MBO0929927.1 hypothetical protein [Fibrella aquatilis]
MTNVVLPAELNRGLFPHFYVVDETSRYQIEAFMASGQVQVVRVIPVPLKGHQILECTFTN